MNVFVYIVVGLGIVVVMLTIAFVMRQACDYLERGPQRRARRRLFEEFREVFTYDFSPERQREVDGKLGFLATIFYYSCEAQGVLGTIKGPSVFHNGWIQIRTRVEYDVEVTKKDFWRAHEIAKKLGFEVRGHYTDYLIEESVSSLEKAQRLEGTLRFVGVERASLIANELVAASLRQ